MASGVTYESVEAACVQLFSEGKSTSFNAVYELIGRKGSAAIVQAHISLWKKKAAGQLQPRIIEGLSPEESLCVDDFVRGILVAAEARAWERLAEHRAACDERCANLDARVCQMEADLSAATNEVDIWIGNATDSETRLSEEKSERARVQCELDDARVEIQRLNSTVAELQESLHKEQMAHSSDVSQMQLTSAEQRSALLQEHSTEIATLSERHQQEVAQEKDRARGDSMFLLEETARTREALGSEVQTLRAEVAKLNGQLRDSSEQIVRYRLAAAEAKEARASAEATNRELRGFIEKHSRETKEASPEAKLGLNE